MADDPANKIKTARPTAQKCRRTGLLWGIAMCGSVLRLIPILIVGIAFSLLPHSVHAELDCYECHGTKTPPDYRPLDDSSRNPATGGFRGNHRTHLGPASGPGSCNACHAGSHGTPSTYTPDHSDGKIALGENINNSPHPAGGSYVKGSDTPVFFNQTTVPVLGSCSNVNCHFETETPEWSSPPFVAPADCDKCHSANPTTGSHPGTGGKHAGFACISCHPGAAATFGHATSGRLRVEFSPVPGGRYTGDLNKFLPSQSAGKTYGECTNVYCHSDGTAVATGAVGSRGATFGNRTTPVWGSTGGSTTCTTCHDYPPGYGQAYYVKSSDPYWAAMAGPKANLHILRWHYDEPCSACHYGTTTDGTTITDPARHANGVYDVIPGADIGFRYDYDPSGGSCSAVNCHGWGAHPHTTERWGDYAYQMNLPYPVKTACRTYTFTANESELYMQTNWHWPDLPPVKVTWDFGDGTKAYDTFNVSHRYEQPGNYLVTFTARDRIQHLTYGSNYLTVDNANIKPVTNVVSSVDGMTATLTDLSRDADYNSCGHSGPGTVYIDWNDGTASVTQSIDLTDAPSNTVFRHVYQNAGTYNIVYQVRDNSGDYTYPQIPRLTVQVPSGSTTPLSVFNGHVTDHTTGLGFAGVTVQLANPKVIPSIVATTTTDGAGYYQFTDFPLDITYTVEVAREGYQFTPAAKSAYIWSGNAGQTVTNDFHTSVPDTEPKIHLGGRITDANGNGLLAFISLLKGDVTVRTTETNRDTGLYTFGDVDDDCYIVKPSYNVSDGYLPETREVCFTDNEINFVRTPRSVIAQITGSIQDDAGAGISNVTVSLKNADGKIISTQTTNGTYSFSNSLAGCYTIEPQKLGYTFAPSTRSICGTGGETIIDQHFAGQPTGPLVSIGGQIGVQTGGTVYAGVYLKKDGKVLYQKGVDGTTGAYLFDQVPDGCYTVEPLDERFVFTPTSQEVCGATSSANFTATIRETMNVGGEVYTRDGIPLRYPVTLNIKDSWGNVLASPVTYASTDSNLGKYWTTLRKECVTVEPVAGIFTFTPSVQAVCQATSNVNFKAADTRFLVKGRVTDQAGAPLENVTLYLQDTNGATLRSQQTITGGYYSFGKLGNACYMVVPAAGAYPYSPLSMQVCEENTGVNFTAVTAGSETVATPLSSTAINVTWLDSPDETGYTVQRCTGADCADFSDIATLDADITQYTDASACSETSYTYRTKSFNSAGERFSTPASASTPAPVAPTDLAASAQSENRTMLSWSHAGSDLTGFRIERCGGAECSDFAVVATVGAETRTFFDSGFAPGSYSYRIRAYKDAGCPWESGPTNAISIETSTPALDDFAVTVADSTSSIVSWTDNSVTATGYSLERCTGEGCGNFSEVASLDKDPAALMVLNMDEPAWNGITGEVMDSSGNDRHGTAMNGSSTVAGRFGRAASFDGIDDYLVAGVDGRSLTQWTVEMWIRPEPLNSQKTIFQWGDSTNVDTSNWYLRLMRNSNGTVQWWYPYYIGGTNPYTNTSYSGEVAAPDSEWTHIVLTYNGTRLRTYGNGVLTSTGQVLNLVQSDKALYAMFGAGKGYSTGTRFKGLIDGAVIYRRALSPAEVLARYERGSDLSVCSATSYTYRVKAVNKGLSNSGGGCWSKRAPVTIATFRPDFQTRVVVPFDPAMKPAFDDVRFYDAGSGKELPYWLDSKTDEVTATFWVRTGRSDSIHLYYGNPSATSSSDGRSTFESFDDFRDPIGNTYAERPKWLETIWSYANDNGYQYLTAANGTANLTFGSAYNYIWTLSSKGTELLETGVPLGNDFHAQIRLNSYTVNNQTFAGIALSDTAKAYTFGRYRNDTTAINDIRVEKLDGSAASDLADTTLPAYLAIKKVGSSYSFFQSRDNATWTMVGNPVNDITPTRLSLFGKEITASSSALAISFDDFLIRKYAAEEPAATVGVGEDVGTCSTLGWDHPYSAPVTVTTPTPGAPSGLALTTYDTEIGLAWTRNTTDETGFRIERCQGAGCSNYVQIATVGRGVTSYSDVGLILGASYSYRVKAYKTASCGWETAYSDAAATTTVLRAPELSVTPFNTTQMNLSWVDNSRSETGFTVERCQGESCSGFSPIASLFGTGYADGAVCSGETYTYRVQAVSSGFSNSGGGCWQWRVPVTISNFIPDHPTRVALVANAAIKSDYSDIRFFDATTGRELPHWLEGVGSSFPAAWVRTGQNNTVYMYFGNPSATSASNGKAVFEVFDDFNDGQIDSALWTLLSGNGSITESGNTLNFSYTGAAANDWSANAGERQSAALRLKTLPAGDFVAAVKLNSYTVPTLTHAGIAVYGSDTDSYLWGRYSGPSHDYGLTKLDGVLIGTYSTSALPQLFAVKRVGGSYSFLYGSDNNYLQPRGNIYNDIPFNGLVLFGKEWGTNNLSFGLEYFLVRKVAAKEPSGSHDPNAKIQATICGAVWNAPYSDHIAVTAPQPAPPTELSATVVSPTRINLSWSQTSDETGFRIERCSSAGCADFAEIATVGADIATFSDGGLVGGTSYSYRVRGFKTTPHCSWSSGYSNTATALAALASPGGLTATPESGNTITLSWTDTAVAETGYRIERCEGPSCTDFTEIASIGPNVTSYPDTSVQSGVSYTYRVRPWSGGLFESGTGCWAKKSQVYLSSNFQPNYQNRVTIYYSPTQTPGLNPDFSDVRFFDETAKKEIPYWIEKIVPGANGSQTATVWYKSGPTNTIYMYFGNKNAASVSSGKKTFEVFDDFSDGVLDNSLWSLLAGNGSITESGGELRFSYSGDQNNDWNAGGRQGAGLLMSALPAGDFLAEVKLNDYAMTDQSFAGISAYGSDSAAYLLGRYKASTYYSYGLQKQDGTTLATASTNTVPLYLGIKKIGASYSFFQSADNAYWSAVGGSYSDVPLNGIALVGKEVGSSGVTFSMGQFYVRKAVAVEPSPSVRADYHTAVSLCTDVWEGPYGEATAVTP